jgi:serine/threonine protein kinase
MFSREDFLDGYTLLSEQTVESDVVVYRARHRDSGREVALKIFGAPLTELSVDGLSRAITVAESVARLQHHNIVSLTAVERLEEGGLALVMPYLPMQSLREARTSLGPFSAKAAERVLADVAGALSYAQSHGEVHSELSPDAISLELGTRRALITDFGIAYQLGDPAARQSTSLYLAPEQQNGSPSDPRASLYSLGLVMWELLVGRSVPWAEADGSSVMLGEELPSIEAERPNQVPARLQYVVERLLRSDPQDRWESAEALLSTMRSPMPPRDWVEWEASFRGRLGDNSLSTGRCTAWETTSEPSSRADVAVATSLKYPAAQRAQIEFPETSGIVVKPQRPWRSGLAWRGPIAVLVAAVMVATTRYTRTPRQVPTPRSAVEQGLSPLLGTPSVEAKPTILTRLPTPGRCQEGVPTLWCLPSLDRVATPTTIPFKQPPPEIEVPIPPVRAPLEQALMARIRVAVLGIGSLILAALLLFRPRGDAVPRKQVPEGVPLIVGQEPGIDGFPERRRVPRSGSPRTPRTGTTVTALAFGRDTSPVSAVRHRHGASSSRGGDAVRRSPQVMGTLVDAHMVRFGVPLEDTVPFIPGHLVISSGLDNGRAIRFIEDNATEGTTVTFGRGPGDLFRHVQLEDDTIEALHAWMQWDGLRWSLVGIAQENPIALNGLALPTLDAQLLSDGDLIEIGDVLFTFRQP